MPPPPEEFAADLERNMRRHPYDIALDRARRTVNERRFALGVQLIDRRRDPLGVALGYARVAEGTLLALGKAALVPSGILRDELLKPPEFFGCYFFALAHREAIISPAAGTSTLE